MSKRFPPSLWNKTLKYLQGKHLYTTKNTTNVPVTRSTSTKVIEKPKCGELLRLPKHTSSLVRHGESSVMVWLLMEEDH